MGSAEDAQAALDHRNYVYSTTNDQNQRNIADAAYQRARDRATAEQNAAAQKPAQPGGKPKSIWDMN